MTGDVRLLHGDCLDVLRADQLGYPHALGYHPPAIPDASVDVIVTDPPYGLEFMGKDWDAPWRYGFAATGYTDGAARIARPNFGSSRNPMCRACRKHQRGAERCQCAAPDYDERPADSSRMFGAWCEAWAAECLRVLKPGGWLLAFGGTRTVHRLTTGIEDAGYEIRDGIDWLYGSGFPKSLDVSKAINAHQKTGGSSRIAARRAALGADYVPHDKAGSAGTRASTVTATTTESAQLGEDATDDAARWSGWGTALKPAREPIVMARKPLAGTVAATVLAYGTGALNIDACRVPAADAAYAANCSGDRGHADNRGRDMDFRMGAGSAHDGGRWPSNVVLSHSPWCEVCECGARGPHDETPHCYAGDVDCLSGCPVVELDAQSGTSKSPAPYVQQSAAVGIYGPEKHHDRPSTHHGDTGGASRFFPVFRYQAKAPARERPKVGGVAHPTVKPVALMRWLVRLVCPPGGVVLDPFAGSGTTGEACRAEGFACVLIEREADYLPLIESRIARHTQAALL